MGVVFNGWDAIGRVLAVGAAAYIALVLMLRISGKRTLAKLNAFDLVVTVALGSTLATVLLSKDVALAEGVTAFALLAVLQFVVTWLSVRSGRVRRAVRSEPVLVFHGGGFITATLTAERLTEREVHQAARSQGIGSMDEVAAVVLETDGSLSVLRQAGDGPASTLKYVRRA